MTGAGTDVTGARHPAAVAEDAVNDVVRAVLRRLTWREGVVPYLGYGRVAGAAGCHGDRGWVRVLARVLMTRHQGSRGPGRARRGWRSFVTAHAAGARVVVDVAGTRHIVTADRAGVVDVVLPADLPAGRHRIELTAGGGVPVAGAVLVHGPGIGDGLVSDIDDTIMVTWLPRPVLAAWNAFVLRETARTEVPGIADLYARLGAALPGLAVFYLSTGAWNAAPALSRFIGRHGLPEGPLLLTDWGPTNTGWFRSGREHKERSLARLAEEFPDLRWVLVGDDGQNDPDIYGRFAAQHPDRVRAVALRQLTPVEQVLAKGTVGGVVGTEAAPAGPIDAGEDAPPGVPTVTAPDGTGLAERLRERGVLPA